MQFDSESTVAEYFKANFALKYSATVLEDNKQQFSNYYRSHSVSKWDQIKSLMQPNILTFTLPTLCNSSREHNSEIFMSIRAPHPLDQSSGCRYSKHLELAVDARALHNYTYLVQHLRNLSLY